MKPIYLIPFAILLLAALHAFASAEDTARPMLDSEKFAAALNASKTGIDRTSGRFHAEIYGVKAVFAPGMDVALVGNETIALPGCAEFDAGKLLIPAAAVALVNSSAFRQKSSAPILLQPEAIKPKNFTVALDPGHVGGPNEGGHGHGLAEYAVVFDVAKKTAEELKKRGFSVLMTRTSKENLGLDYNTDLENRPALANKTGADIFVSIHANESDNPDATGFEIYYAPLKSASELALRLLDYDIPARVLGAEEQPADEAKKKTAWRRILAKKDDGSAKLAEKMRASFAAGAGDADRGVKEAQHRVTTLTFCPSILIEIGFLTNRETAERFADAAHRTKLAKCIADGIEEYWKETGGE